MSRKTIKVEDVRVMVNDMLLNSPDSSKAERDGMISVLESILHKTGNYEGFMYLDKDDMEQSECGCSVGIHRFDDSSSSFEDTDHTRVKYF